ncbi:GvpL/GvpF family gas vesicle protein [Streptomyces sp. NPDC090306]|uniref:GvpL/GvpF family gas vesicle protein n=1 Tax=Streptomyces sp. NPDC090306 TaxID=3365961 RepID=UPI0038122A8B
MSTDSAELPHAERRTAEGDFVTYVFVVTDSPPSAGELAAVAGHEGGGPLRAVAAAGGLSLVVQDVPAARFDEQALAARLNDPRELERCVLAHHRGVEGSGGRGAVVPLPMATLYLSDANAVEAVERREADLRAVLGRLRSRTEMAVKVHVSPSGPAAGDAADAPGGAPAPPDGRGYLSRASARQRESRDRHEIARSAAHTVDLVLRRHAVAATRHRAQSEQLTGRPTAQLLNAAYLVDDEHLRYFRSALDRLRADERCAGVEIVASGPWIPYSFAGLDAPFDRVATEVRV